MNFTITNKKDYISHCDVSKYLKIGINKMRETLFGKEIVLSTDPWLWHFHIKCCNRCNANCDFCIEKNCRPEERPEIVVQNAEMMLSEMEKKGILHSVSVTGGEPLLFPEILGLFDVLRKHKIKFLTMNTNGGFIYVKKFVPLIDGLFDFLNVSRHSMDDMENFKIFHTYSVLKLEELQCFHEFYHKTKLRIQCVMQCGMTISDFDKMIETYRFADNVSFRRLMSTAEEQGLIYDRHDDDYFRIIDHVSQNGEFIEQTVQDYYVYEIWNYHGVNVTFSYSDMKSLIELEKTEPDEIVREFILHPNGNVCGSWNPERKVILRG